MNSENKFILLKILQEIEFNLKNSCIDFEGLIQMIINKRIFVTGAGRTGFIMKSFGIRLMQLGFDVFFIGDTNTPSTSKRDLLIIGFWRNEHNISSSEKIEKNWNQYNFIYIK